MLNPELIMYVSTFAFPYSGETPVPAISRGSFRALRPGYVEPGLADRAQPELTESPLRRRDESDALALSAGAVGREGNDMLRAEHAVGVEAAANAVRGLIIVSRDQPELWRELEREFGHSEDIQVILDRRQAERRRRPRFYTGDRPVADRRSLPRIEDDIRLRQYVLVRPHYRTPRD